MHLSNTVQSIASVGTQRLLLDRHAIPLLSGKRVLVVDDVVATGSSLSASISLARKAGANIVGIGVNPHRSARVAGRTRRRMQTLFAGLGHIPQFRIENGKATIIPSSRKPRGRAPHDTDRLNPNKQEKLMSILRLVASAYLSCCPSFAAPSAWAQDNVRLAGTYTVSSALPYYVARDKGYFTAENLS